MNFGTKILIELSSLQMFDSGEIQGMLIVRTIPPSPRRKHGLVLRSGGTNHITPLGRTKRTQQLGETRYSTSPERQKTSEVIQRVYGDMRGFEATRSRTGRDGWFNAQVSSDRILIKLIYKAGKG